MKHWLTVVFFAACVIAALPLAASARVAEEGDFSQPCEADFDFSSHAAEELALPDFSMEPLSFTYDGAVHYLGFSSLSHSLEAEGAFSFRWFKNGEEISSYGSRVEIKNVSDSGVYKCTVTFSHGNRSVSAESGDISVEVLRREVEIPQIPKVEYSANPISPDVYSISLYTVENFVATDAGVYSVRLTLCDGENYVFSNGESEAYADFEIVKAKNFFVEPFHIEDFYEGEQPRYRATSRFGTPTLLFSKYADKDFSESLPSEAGSYFAKVCVGESENYGSLASDALEFCILSDSVDEIFILSLASRQIYSSFDSFDVSGLSLGARYKSGRVVDIPRDELCVSYKNGDGLRFGDNYVTVSYMGVNISHPITVYPAEYDMSGVEFFDEEFIYDGSVHYPTPVGKLPTGVDGSSPSVSFSSGVLNVSEGKVTVTVYFYSESENYANPKPMTVSLCVLPRGVSVSWGEAEHIYSGEPFLPSASCAECEISLSGAGTAVGEYTARAVSLDSNYYVLNGELTFKILKAENSWAEEPSIESIFATGILSPVGKSAFGVTEYLFKSEEEIIEMPRVVGRYYFKAYSSGDENHYAMESEWIEFEIKAVFALDFWVELSRSEFLTLSQISDNDISAFAEYNDGSVKEIPFSEIEIVYNSGDCFSVGDSSVSFRFSELCASGKISVQKRVIGLPEIPSVEYSGKNQAPNEIDLDLFDYEFGEMRDVGKYEITLSVKDTENYEFENGKTQCVALFEIEKRRITVKISDIEKYFFSKESEPGFEVVSGALISGEPLVCEYIVSGEAVNAVFENSNYEVNVIQGKVVEYKRLSPGDSRSAFLLVIIFIFSMLAFVFIYINRKRILEEYREHLSKSDSFIPSMPEAEKSKPSAIEKRKFKSDLSVSGNAEEERAEVIAEKIGEIEFESSEQTVIDAAYADGTITDSLAKDLLRRDIDIITDGRRRRIINIDTLSRSFASGDRIDINILKEKRLIPYDTGYIKVLARGIIDKPLDVYANEFSLTAVKMIVLSGGKAVRVSTQRKN